MFAKFVLLFFCCALIDAKSLVRSDPRFDVVNEEEKFQIFPDIFKNAIRDVENFEVNDKAGASPLVQTDKNDEIENKSKENDISDSSDSEEGDDDIEETDANANKTKVEENKEQDADEEESEEDTEEKDDDNEEPLEKKENEKEESEEEKEESEEESSKEAETEKQKEDDENVENDENSSDSSEEDENINQNTTNFNPSYATVGTMPQSLKSFDFPTSAQSNLFQDALQNPTISKHINTLANLVDWQKMAKNVLPSVEKFLPKSNLEQSEVNFSDMDEDTLKQNIDVMEKNNANAENEFTETGKPSTRIEFDWDDLNMDPVVGNFISQAIPESIKNLQIPAKLRGLKDMWMNNVNRHFKAPVQKEPKVGFGGWDKQQKAMFGDLTSYVNKAVEQAQTKLEDNGRSIEVNNPSLTINVIPQIPITFTLKRVEGAHTIDKYGQSKAIRYNKLYAFTQYKFLQLRYDYDVLIQPFNLFGIRKSITIILNDARTRMNLSVEKDQKLNVLGLEFVNPDVMVDCKTDRFTNYAVNYLINDVHPVIKQKVVEIVSRDSKLILANYLKDAQ